VEKLVKIQIPATLKKQLVDDWDSVTQQDKVHGKLLNSLFVVVLSYMLKMHICRVRINGCFS